MKKKSFMFVQVAHPYRHEFLVCVGMKAEDVAKKVTEKECRDFVLKSKDLFEQIATNKKAGFTAFHQDKGYILLLLPSVENTWEYWEALLHELSHVVDDISHMKWLQEEGEARAYLHEWLFREIRRKLSGVQKTPKL